jgi:hypothetical protein
MSRYNRSAMSRPVTPREPDGVPAYPGAPRWAKVLTVVMALLLLLIAVVLVGSLLGLHTPMGHGG